MYRRVRIAVSGPFRGQPAQGSGEVCANGRANPSVCGRTAPRSSWMLDCRSTLRPSGNAILDLALEPLELNGGHAAQPATILPPACGLGHYAVQDRRAGSSCLRDSDGRFGSTLEPAETARPRLIEGQERSFNLNCEGSSRSGIFPCATGNNPCLGGDERERRGWER
jgi:hypothetical protein